MSICIVHRDGWAACDSRTTMGSSMIFPSVAKKAFSASGWLTACVGPGLLECMARKLIPECHETEVLTQLSEALRDTELQGGALLMTNRQRDLILVDSLGALETIEESHQFWAIGCCEEMVLGYLARITEHEKRDITVADATAAIKMTAKYDSGIDDRVKVFYLNG